MEWNSCMGMGMGVDAVAGRRRPTGNVLAEVRIVA
jgi:hypothetical protein